MGKDVFWTTVTFAIIISVLILAFWPADKGNIVIVKYDCTKLAGQTNIPATVLEECRKREGK